MSPDDDRTYSGARQPPLPGKGPSVEEYGGRAGTFTGVVFAVIVTIVGAVMLLFGSA